MNGVSMVICCHNSTKMLRKTLDCLLKQEVSKNIPWEVIVIDNASTDNTSRVALTSWPEDAPAPLRVVQEVRLGLTHARYRGLKEAKYKLIGFIDHDNWVAPDWVETAIEVMNEHPEVGACGGLNEAVFEAEPPWWFKYYKHNYAIGPQGPQAGYISWTRAHFWGAGMVIRKSAWQELVNKGFRPWLMGRQGKRLSCGEDTELCYALRLSGWRLWYEPRLRLSHYIQAHRLKWRHLRRMRRKDGAADACHDFYVFALKASSINLHSRFRQLWKCQILDELKKLVRQFGKLLLSFFRLSEGDNDIILIEKRLGRLLELLRRFRTFDISMQEIYEASWNKRN